jgi:hypothetical protein
MAAEIEPKPASSYEDKNPRCGWVMEQKSEVALIGPGMAKFLAAGGELPRGKRA